MTWRLSRTVGTAAWQRARARAAGLRLRVRRGGRPSALSLHTRTQALHQTLAGYPATTKTVQVTGSWGNFAGSMQSLQPGQQLNNVLPQMINDVGYGLRGTPSPASCRTAPGPA